MQRKETGWRGRRGWLHSGNALWFPPADPVRFSRGCVLQHLSASCRWSPPCCIKRRRGLQGRTLPAWMRRFRRLTAPFQPECLRYRAAAAPQAGRAGLTQARRGICIALPAMGVSPPEATAQLTFKVHRDALFAQTRACRCAAAVCAVTNQRQCHLKVSIIGHVCWSHSRDCLLSSGFSRAHLACLIDSLCRIHAGRSRSSAADRGAEGRNGNRLLLQAGGAHV